MAFPERFSNLPEYAFPRLRALLDPHPAGGDPIAMTIGEPKHPMPGFVRDVLAEATSGFGVYPPNDGSPALLAAITGWLKRRYGVDIGPERVLALNGTREGLFNAAIALCPEQKRGQTPVILMPNPFYQVYAIAALAVQAEPVYVPAVCSGGFLPDFDRVDPAILDRTALVYICSPANPQGAVASADYLAGLLSLAERHDFVVLADECYAEVWRTAPPPGLLQVAAATKADPERAFVFHSLSKRSNLPGLRSGFVAGGANGIAAMRKLRNFAGAPLPLPLQAVAERCWQDEAHVEESRALYHQKFEDAADILGGVQGFSLPDGGFFLWLPVEDGEAAAVKLWRDAGVGVLPGAYLSRDVGGENPGAGYIRVALVAPRDETRTGLTRLRDSLYA